MTAVESPTKHSRPATDAGRAVTALALRQTRRGALVVTGLAAGMSAVAVAAYASTVKDPADAAALEALAGNPAIRTLFGEPVALDDAGGFAVWRTGTVLAVVLAVWALLAATRITRGEEDVEPVGCAAGRAGAGHDRGGTPCRRPGGGVTGRRFRRVHAAWSQRVPLRAAPRCTVPGWRCAGCSSPRWAR